MAAATWKSGITSAGKLPWRPPSIPSSTKGYFNTIPGALRSVSVSTPVVRGVNVAIIPPNDGQYRDLRLGELAAKWGYSLSRIVQTNVHILSRIDGQVLGVL